MRYSHLVGVFLVGIIALAGCGGGGGGETETSNETPTADAGIDKTAQVNQSVNILGSGNDTDGTIVSYQWKKGSTVLADTASFDYTPTTTGIHTLTLTVTDNEGATDSDTMDVNVTDEHAATRTIPLVIVRIEFNDYEFKSSASEWSQKIFGANEGQLNHYYKEISYGKFQFQPAIETDGDNDGIITVYLDENHPDELQTKIDRLKNAAILANENIDFARYDADDNGKISSEELQIVFLAAGGELATSAHPGVWAHQWCMDTSINVEPPTLDGVKLMSCDYEGVYAAFGEKHFDVDNGNDATIGIIAHELGHAVFGLLDLYDTDESSEGIGNFGLMGAGSWGYKENDLYPGATPVHMTGWSKAYSGFVVPTVVADAQELQIKAASSANYMLYKIPTGRSGEYFLVENRANSGYDRGLYILEEPGDFKGGLSILHIDDNLLNDCSTTNSCNENESHKLVDVEEANNPGLDANPKLDINAHRGDYLNLFFQANNASFTPSTEPDSNRYDGTGSGVSITNISAPGDIMSVDLTTKTN